MVEINVRGPVEKRTRTDSGKYQDGSDTEYRSVQLVERAEVDICIEFPDGHVNLEGYSPARMGMGLEETSLYRYVPEGWAIVDQDDWDVSIDGTMREWVIQARRYIQERPDMSVEDALRAFEAWEETNVDAEYTIENEL